MSPALMNQGLVLWALTCWETWFLTFGKYKLEKKSARVGKITLEQLGAYLPRSLPPVGVPRLRFLPIWRFSSSTILALFTNVVFCFHAKKFLLSLAFRSANLQ